MKNFKSYKNVEINFESKKSKPKSLVIIYGPNGSGKTTISKAFEFLSRTMQTMKARNILADVVENKIIPPSKAEEHSC